MKICIILLLGFFSVSAQDKLWSLQDCINYAFENNLSVIQATINNELTEIQIENAKNQKLPNISANLNNQLLLGKANVPITNTSQIVNLSSENFQRYGLGVGINSNVTIYNGGALELNQKKAELDFLSGVYSTEDLKNDISLNVVNNYLTILLNKEIEKVAKEQLLVSENQLERNKKLYHGGAIPLSNVYEVEAQVAQDKQQWENAKIGVEQARFNLAQVLQLPNYKIFDVLEVQIPQELELGLYDLETIQNYAIEHQPQTKSAEYNIKSAEVDIDLAKSAYKPIITGGYGFNTNYNDFLNTSNDVAFFTQLDENLTHAFNINISIPIFNKFLTDLNVEQAQIQSKLAKTGLDIEKQNLRQDVQQAYFEVNTNFQQYQSAKEAVRSAQISFDFAEKSFKAGQITIYDFNQNSNNLFAAKSQMLQAKYNYLFRLKVLDFYAGKSLEFIP